MFDPNNFDYHIQDLKALINLFFINEILDKHKLQQFVLKHLDNISSQLDYYLYSPKYQKFWHHLRDHCVISLNQELCINGVKEIEKTADQVKDWLKESVESSERLEFFILSKACEIASGDKEKDYYHAQFIRHDQLLAVVIVFGQAYEHILAMLELPSNKIYNSVHFNFFQEKSIEARIYEKAEQFYQVRKDIGILGKV